MRSLGSIRQVYKRIFSDIPGSTLLPSPLCILCGDKGRSHQFPLCISCESDLPLISHPCHCCNRPLSPGKTINLCGQCLHEQPFFQKSTIPLEYVFPTTHIIKQLKYKEKILHSGILSRILLDKINQNSDPLPESIIPVPLHPFRLIKRGFNQSALVAKTVAQELAIPVDLQSCRRIRNTLQQAGFSEKQRKKNIRNAFSVNNSFSCKHVAILDDVVTTGSTVNELARVLQLAGAETIEIWACARTVPDI